MDEVSRPSQLLQYTVFKTKFFCTHCFQPRKLPDSIPQWSIRTRLQSRCHSNRWRIPRIGTFLPHELALVPSNEYILIGSRVIKMQGEYRIDEEHLRTRRRTPCAIFPYKSNVKHNVHHSKPIIYIWSEFDVLKTTKRRDNHRGRGTRKEKVWWAEQPEGRRK